jgi:hypothetical protein
VDERVERAHGPAAVVQLLDHWDAEVPGSP